MNFEWIRGFARTQDLRPIKTFNYAMMGWSRSMINVLKKGQLFDEDTQLIESSKWSSFLLKNHNDLEFIKILFNVATLKSILINSKSLWFFNKKLLHFDDSIS